MPGKKTTETAPRPGEAMRNLDELFRNVIGVSNKSVREKMDAEKRARDTTGGKPGRKPKTTK